MSTLGLFLSEKIWLTQGICLSSVFADKSCPLRRGLFLTHIQPEFHLFSHITGYLQINLSKVYPSLATNQILNWLTIKIAVWLADCFEFVTLDYYYILLPFFLFIKWLTILEIEVNHVLSLFMSVWLYRRNRNDLNTTRS